MFRNVSLRDYDHAVMGNMQGLRQVLSHHLTNGKALRLRELRKAAPDTISAGRIARKPLTGTPEAMDISSTTFSSLRSCASPEPGLTSRPPSDSATALPPADMAEIW